MNVQLLSDLTGRNASFALLESLFAKEDGVSQVQLYDFMKDAEVLDPDTLFDLLQSYGVLTQYGGVYSLSRLGQRTRLLLAATNSVIDLQTMVSTLREITPDLGSYEIVKEGMTGQFISGLHSRPDFLKIYLCSPWIILDEKSRGRLKTAVAEANRLASTNGRRVEVLCISRPPGGGVEQKRGMEKTLNFLRDEIGAEVITHQKLHSKLYIREPDISGGLQMAIMGSQNMTSSQHLELGLRITNDTVMITRLIQYFMSIWMRGEDY